MCGGGFKLKITTKMQGTKVDAFVVAAADERAKWLKTDWDGHHDPKGEISKKSGEAHAFRLQVDISHRYHKTPKNKSLMSMSEQQGTPRVAHVPVDPWVGRGG